MPPILSASARLTASPSPVPGMAELRADLRREKRMKRFPWSSAEIPTPSSVTVRTTCPSSERADRFIAFPPNLSELTAKLTITCWMRAASPRIRSGRVGSTVVAIRAPAALGSSIFTTFSSTSRGLNGESVTL